MYFYKTVPSAGADYALLAFEQEKYELFTWVPDTGLWHRERVLENDFIFGDDGGVYEQVGINDAAKLLTGVRHHDERYTVDRRSMDLFRKQSAKDKRTSAEMGLEAAAVGKRPMSAPGLA